MITITRKIEFDAGHRVPGHQGACKRPHGHHYVVEVEVAGDVPADGMLLDFGVLKQVMVEAVHDVYDHRFMVWHDDVMLISALTDVDPECVVVMREPPTAENIGAQILEDVGGKLLTLTPPIAIVGVRVWETPNCSAHVTA